MVMKLGIDGALGFAGIGWWDQANNQLVAINGNDTGPFRLGKLVQSIWTCLEQAATKEGYKKVREKQATTSTTW